MSEQLQRLLANRKNASEFRGIYSVCSAHPWVLRAAMQQAKASGGPLLIEATSNQVNQFGGYTGMQPADFYRSVFDLAQQEQFSAERLILGGDHLGPNPWQHLPAAEAMAHAETMVAAYAAAGFASFIWMQACHAPTIHLRCPTRSWRSVQLACALRRNKLRAWKDAALYHRHRGAYSRRRDRRPRPHAHDNEAGCTAGHLRYINVSLLNTGLRTSGRVWSRW